MNRTLLVLAAGVAVLVADPRPGAAREWYPWCAQYADTRNLIECAYTSFEQCQASVSGVGGSCVQNVRSPPAAPRDRRYQPFYR